MLVEAFVLDRDDRLLHDRGDLFRVDEDPAFRPAQRREDRVVVVRVDVAVDVVLDRAGVAVGDLAGDGRDQAEAERAEPEQHENEEEGGESKLADSTTASVRDGRRLAASAAEQAPGEVNHNDQGGCGNQP